MKPPPIVLTIAGFDPSSGAGITSDIKTIAAHNCYGASCITALTVQSTSGVQRVEPTSPEVLRETLSALADDMEFAAVHIGMLASGAIAAAVADFLQERKLRNVIVDPILKSSSGTDLIDEAGVNLIKERLFPLATAITPNTHEAAVLTNLPVTSLQEMKIAAGQMHLLGAEAVIITGGHLKTPEDLLSVSRRGEVEQKVFSGELVESRATHGTGCAFATALACQLALGQKLDEAVSLAKTYVMESIAHAYPVGKGIGPVNHLYAFHPKESKTKT